MINKDDVIKRINERLKMTALNLQFDKHEHNAPGVHSMVAVLLEVIEEEVNAAATQANEQIKKLQDQIDVIRPRVM